MPSIGDTLRRQRVQTQQTSDEAAEAIGLPKRTLADLEAGKLPLEDTKVRAYLRMYARHLGLNAEELLQRLDNGQNRAPGPDERGRARRSRGRPGPAETPPVAAAPVPLDPPAAPDPAAGPETAAEWPPPDAPLPEAFAIEPPAPPAQPRRRFVYSLLAFTLLAAAVAVGVVVWDNWAAYSTLLTVPSTADTAVAGDGGDTPLTAGESPPVLADAAEESPPDAATDAADPDSANADPTGSGAGVGPPPDEPSQPDDATAADVRAPEDTLVQVLHNAADPVIVEEVTAVLEALGYQVVQVNAARVPFERTTVFAGEGWEPEAHALLDRDERFGVVAPNDTFSPEVHLHVAIGPDWSAADAAPPGRTRS